MFLYLSYRCSICLVSVANYLSLLRIELIFNNDIRIINDLVLMPNEWDNCKRGTELLTINSLKFCVVYFELV